MSESVIRPSAPEGSASEIFSAAPPMSLPWFSGTVSAIGPREAPASSDSLSWIAAERSESLRT